VNFPHFFIDRPIFAGVISIVITLIGVIALATLPIAQYPEIAPPTIQVTTNYPGANAKVVSETVATPIEQQVNGVENMLYMSSQSTSDGNMTLSITFKLGTNLDTAQVLVQNRVAINHLSSFTLGRRARRTIWIQNPPGYRPINCSHWLRTVYVARCGRQLLAKLFPRYRHPWNRHGGKRGASHNHGDEFCQPEPRRHCFGRQ
jgi:hypothetical protein